MSITHSPCVAHPLYLVDMVTAIENKLFRHVAEWSLAHWGFPEGTDNPSSLECWPDCWCIPQGAANSDGSVWVNSQIQDTAEGPAGRWSCGDDSVSCCWCASPAFGNFCDPKVVHGGQEKFFQKAKHVWEYCSVTLMIISFLSTQNEHLEANIYRERIECAGNT